MICNSGFYSRTDYKKLEWRKYSEALDLHVMIIQVKNRYVINQNMYLYELLNQEIKFIKIGDKD